jgi:hypothetical protein
MNLYNRTDLDFGITSTYPYEGSVVFRQEGVGSTLTTTAIKQGQITVSDTVDLNTISPTQINSEDVEMLKEKLYELSVSNEYNNQSTLYRNIAIGCFIIVVLFVILKK